MVFSYQNYAETLKTSIDIVDVIKKHISLDENNKGLCPFHNDSNPSFSIKPKGQYFYCFGCGKGGDVIKFVQLINNVSFIEAITMLSNEYGVQLPKLTDGAKKRLHDESLRIDILNNTANYYHNQLNAEVLEYLINERGFSEETVKQNKIGYAKGGLHQYLLNDCKFPMDICVDSGVVNKKGNGGADFFHNRIIFPNIKNGNVVHLTGRALDGSIPKYLHLADEIKYLFNEDALSHNKIFIAEGVPDAITLDQNGYPSVGVYGANTFKDSFVNKFSKCEEIYICLDGDRSGREGTLKIASLIGDRSRLIEMPHGTDVNEFFLHNSKEDFEKLIESSSDIFHFMLNATPASTEKIDLTDKLNPIIQFLSTIDQFKYEIYLKEIKQKFELDNIEFSAIRKLVRENLKTYSPKKEKVTRSIHSSEQKMTAKFDGLVDLVENDGKPAFLIKKKDDDIIAAENVTLDGETYIPPKINDIPWLLPRWKEVSVHYTRYLDENDLEINEKLYDDLYEYHKSISELPDPLFYDLLAAWDFHTYLQDAVSYSPIICFFAVPERGISRTGKGLINVAYRGLHVESLREAYIIRMAENYSCSIFFDVIDIIKKAENNGSMDIIAGRYEKGVKVPRVLYPERGAHNDIVNYSIFGPTIVGTNEPLNHILATRSIVITMPETTRIFENDVKPEFALSLKERLVAFRARYLNESLSSIDKPAKDRLGDIMKPLLQIILFVKPNREQNFRDLIKKLETSRKFEKAESLEAEVIKAVNESELWVENGVVSIEKITERVNFGKIDKYKIGNARVGKILSALGFSKGKNSTGNSMLIWNQTLLDQLYTKYGLGLPSEPSVPPDIQSGGTELTEGTERSDDDSMEDF
jgi:DNA primase catalytic core